MNADTTTKLAIEIERIINAPATGHFDVDGVKVKAATESDVKTHLTTKHGWMSHATGREYRFPGIGGWGFESNLEEAGYKIVEARNFRNQRCRIVIKSQ